MLGNRSSQCMWKYGSPQWTNTRRLRHRENVSHLHVRECRCHRGFQNLHQSHGNQQWNHRWPLTFGPPPQLNPPAVGDVANLWKTETKEGKWVIKNWALSCNPKVVGLIPASCCYSCLLVLVLESNVKWDLKYKTFS